MRKHFLGQYPVQRPASIKGAFYQGAETSQDGTWTGYSGTVISRDFAAAQALGFNCMRTVMGTASGVFNWPTVNSSMLTNLDDMASRAKTLGMKLMLTLFSPDWGFYTSISQSIAYLESILTPARLDPTKIACIELINEAPWLGQPYGGTTVTSGSNGVNVSTFTGTQTLNVGSNASLISPITVATSTGEATITFTGSTSSTVTGCTTTSGTGTLSTGGGVWTHSPADVQAWAQALMPVLKSLCAGSGIPTTMSNSYGTGTTQALAAFSQMVTTLRAGGCEPDFYQYHSYSTGGVFTALELPTVQSAAGGKEVMIGEFGSATYDFRVAYGATPVNGSGVTVSGTSFTFNISNTMPGWVSATGTFTVPSTTPGALITITYTGKTSNSFTGCTSASGTVLASGVIASWGPQLEVAQADYMHEFRYAAQNAFPGSEPMLWMFQDQDDSVVNGGQQNRFGLLTAPLGGQPPSSVGATKAAGAVYSLWPAGTKPSAPVLNGGFENSWTRSDSVSFPRRVSYYYGSGGSAPFPITLALDSGTKHSGAQSLKVSGATGYNGSNPPAVQLNPSPLIVPVVPTGTYAFSAWVLDTSGGSGSNVLQLNISWYTAAAVFISGSTGSLFTPTSSWTQNTLSGAVCPSTAVFAQLFIRVINQTNPIWIDDCTWTNGTVTDS